jgi:hypothetical protein
MRNNADVIARKYVVDAITRFRLDLEEMFLDTNLVRRQASVGLLLYDLVCCLGLTGEEKVRSLGQELVHNIEVLPIDIEIVDDPDAMDSFFDWSELANDQNLTLGNN